MSFLFSHAHVRAHSGTPREPIFATHLLEASFVGEAIKGVVVAAPVGAAYGAAKAWWFNFPMGQGLGLMGSNAGVFGCLTGIYLGTSVFAAHLRGKDDIWNAPIAGFVSGAVVGMRAGSLKKIVFYSSAASTVSLWGQFFANEYRNNFHKSRFFKKQDAPPVFAGNPRDQYKDRWAAIQAREAAAGEAADDEE
ncbi:hypothetical protein HDU81_005438 [Chytriomyces hyalinus]|nr:hypothetical protein HDU81_005438 [Chytriomyces hyalinus]